MNDTGDGPGLAFGQSVFDEDGNELGQIRGLDENGFYVTTEEGVDAFTDRHEISGKEFGEAYLMWRCLNCGEMGEIKDDIPDNCPNCGAPKEDIYYWTED